MLKTYRYALTSRSGSEALTEVLRSAGIPFLRAPIPSSVRTYYDSFDWRLRKAGLLLFTERRGERLRLFLREARSGLDVVVVDVSDAPRYSNELPRGLIRDRVGALLCERRLLPVACVRCRGESFSVLDEEGKTVLRANVERRRAETGDGEVRLPEDLELSPLRGFDEPLNRVRALIERHLDVEALPGHGLDDALRAADRSPQDYRVRPRPSFAPDEAAGDALRVVFLELLAVVEANEDGMRRDLDPAFLGDMRSAIADSRALLDDSGDILTAPHFAHYRGELDWLLYVTAPAHVLDAELGGLMRCAAACPDGALDRFLAILRARRMDARRDLLQALASQRYRAFKAGWRAALETPDPRWTSGPAGTPLYDAVRHMLRRRLDRCAGHGSRLAPGAPDDVFHALRAEVGRLHCIIEVFGRALRLGDVRRTAGVVGDLVEALDEHHALGGLAATVCAQSASDDAAGKHDRAFQDAIERVTADINACKEAAAKRCVHAYSRLAAGVHQKRLRLAAGEREQETCP